jgi:hypothetical protein
MATVAVNRTALTLSYRTNLYNPLSLDSPNAGQQPQVLRNCIDDFTPAERQPA